MRFILPNLLLFWASASVAQPWIPAECSTRHEAEWNAAAQAIRQASPGSPTYVPKPFPKTTAEILEDFKYGFLYMWKGVSADRMPADQRPIFEGIQNGTLKYRIERVEDWTPLRCLTHHFRDYHFLIYIQSGSNGEELGRLNLSQSGFVEGWVASPEKREGTYLEYPTPSLDTALAEARSRFGVNGSNPEYVVSGGTSGCGDFFPCVAFQAQGKIYLLHKGQLFAFGASSKSYKADQMRDLQSVGKVKQSLDPALERLVTAGDSYWVVARKVPPVAR